MEYKWDTPGNLWAPMVKWPVWGARQFQTNPNMGLSPTNKILLERGYEKEHQPTTLKRGCIEMQAIHMTHMTINGFV